MGKLATTYFCENGHLLEDNAHHEFGPRDMCENSETMKCHVCGSTKQHMTLEWHDSGYWANGQPDVPHQPIRKDYVEKTDAMGHKYIQEVDIYDISKVKHRRE